jgi:hypothetical protein
MPYTAYQTDPDGGVTFSDPAGGTVRLPITPAARLEMSRIDQVAPVAPVPIAPVPIAPVPALVATAGATTALGGEAGGAGGAPPAPPAPIDANGGSGGAPQMPDSGPATPIPVDNGVGGRGTVANPVPMAGTPGAAPVPRKVDPSSVVFAAPAATGAPGAGGVDLSDADEVMGRERALRRARAAETGSPYYRIAATPEREQRTNVQRERSLGPDPAIIGELEAIEGGAVPFKAEAPSPLVHDPRAILALFQPPPEAKTEKQKLEWASGVAQQAGQDGLSMATLSTMLPSRQIVAPKNYNGEQVDEYEKQKATKRQELIEAIDAARAGELAQHENVQTMRKAQADAWQEKYGTYGLLGGDTRKAELDANVQEASAEAEAERAEKRLGFAEEKRDAYLAQQDQLQKIRDRIGASVEDIRASRIDDKKFWKEKSTGAKLAAAIAVGMGAYGAAINKGPNHALQIIESAVQADIDAQKANINAKQADLSNLQILYKSVLDETGSKLAATAAMETAAYAKIDDELRKKAAIAGTEKARIVAQQMSGVLRKAQLQRDAAISEAMRGKEATASRVIPATAGGIGGGPKSLTQRIKEAEQDRKAETEFAKDSATVQKETKEAAKGGPERAVWGGTTYEFPNASTPTEGADLRKKLGAAKVQQDVIQRLQELGPTASLDPTVSAQQKLLVTELTQNDQAAKGEGITHENDVELMRQAVSSFMSGRQNLDTLDALLKKRVNSQMEQGGARIAGRK